MQVSGGAFCRRSSGIWKLEESREVIELNPCARVPPRLAVYDHVPTLPDAAMPKQGLDRKAEEEGGQKEGARMLLLDQEKCKPNMPAHS